MLYQKGDPLGRKRKKKCLSPALSLVAESHLGGLLGGQEEESHPFKHEKRKNRGRKGPISLRDAERGENRNPGHCPRPIKGFHVREKET